MEEASKARISLCVEFQVAKVIGVSNDGKYQVQWAPMWVSKSVLVGCDHLIHEFLQQERERDPDDQGKVTSERTDGEQLIKEHLQQPSEREVKDEPENQFEEPYLTIGLVKELLQQPSENEVNDECGDQFGEPYAMIEMEDTHFYRNIDDIEEGSNEKTQLPPFREMKEASNGSDRSINNPTVHLGVVSDTEDSENNCMQLLSETSSSTNIDLNKAVSDLQSFVAHDNNYRFSDGINTTDKLSKPHSSVPLSEVQQHNIEFSDESNTVSRPTCSVCCKEFLGINELVRHLKMHTDLKSFKCPYCERKFSQISNLTKHVRTHTRDHLHSCNVCAYSCIQKSQLTIHMRTHTGEKPYPCEGCGKTFKSKSNLYQHRQRCSKEMKQGKVS